MLFSLSANLIGSGSRLGNVVSTDAMMVGLRHALVFGPLLSVGMRK